MAQHKSAVRQMRRSIRRNAVNKKNKSALRTRMKKLRETIANKDQEGAKKLLPSVFSAIDQAVKKKTIHANTGSRYKSRLHKQVAQLPVSPPK